MSLAGLNMFCMSNGADMLGVAEFSDIIICFVYWPDSRSEKRVFFLDGCNCQWDAEFLLPVSHSLRVSKALVMDVVCRRYYVDLGAQRGVLSSSSY